MTISILSLNNNFLLSTKGFKLSDDISLNQLYLPIIGKNAVFLYQHLLSVKKLNDLAHLDAIQNFTQLENDLNINQYELVNLLNKLEAIGLIKTYLSPNPGEPIIICLQPTLSYLEIINNKSFKELLKQNISESKWQQLPYLFSFQAILPQYQDISTPFSNLTSNSEQKEQSTLIDWTKLEKEIYLKSNKRIYLNEDNKNTLNQYCSDFLLTLENLVDILMNTSVLQKYDHDSFCIDNKKLDEFFARTFNTEIQIPTVSRNYKIFYLHSKVENYPDVVNSYKTMQSENYIISITKQLLKPELSHMLKVIKDKFKLDDSVINVIIDYSFYKNLGRKLEPNYLYKLALTINNLNLTDLNSVIKYFQYVANNIEPRLTDLVNSNQVIYDADESINLNEIWDN